LVSIWPEYSVSPVVTQFRWSPLVLGAVEKNLPPLLPPEHAVPPPGTNISAVIPGLVTLHVRGRDYKTRTNFSASALVRKLTVCRFVVIDCGWMAGWAEFEGWNRLPFLRDRFEPPSPREPYMVSRCWIEIDAIAARLRALRTEYPEARLERVYVSTNADQEWTDELKSTLLLEGWESIVATPDLTLSWKESGVDSAIGMLYNSYLPFDNESSPHSIVPLQIWNWPLEDRSSLGTGFQVSRVLWSGCA
jgi:hypothetical protein